MIKRILTLTLLFLSIAGLTQPQGGENQTRKEKLKAHKIAFISTELELSPEEAEKFWPVYNQMEDEMGSVHKERRGHMKKMRAFADLSDDEAYEITERIFDLDAKENELRKEYLVKFANILGKKKAARVFLAEEKFKRELLKKLKEHPGGQGGGHQSGGKGPNGESGSER